MVGSERGWNLGLGAIYRVLKEGVDYDKNDYAVNNVKLIAVSDWDVGSYSGYAPEIQRDFTKYLKKVNPDGSVNWEVHSKDGKIYYYGTTADSRQDFADGDDVFKWCLDKVKDANGNFMKISYTKDSGQIYLDQIDYTGNVNDNTGTTSSIIFHLEIRDDHNTNYVANYEVKTTKRLNSIEVKNDSKVVRAYALEYDISDHTSRSRLKSVTQYGSDAKIAQGTITGETSLPPHRFEYNDFQVDGSHFDNNADSEGKIDDLVTRDGGNWLFQTDFNGDGKTDLIKINKSGIGTSTIKIELIKRNDDNNKFTVVNTQSWTLDYPFTTFKVGDFNGDGMTDLFQTVESLYKIEGWYMYASNGESLKRVYTEKKVLPDTSWGQAGNEDYVSFTLGDFNGDGKSDILLYKLSHVSDTKNYALYLSPDNSFKISDDDSVNSNNFDFEKVNEGDLDGGEHDNYAINVQIGDFNGDGKSDVLAIDRKYNSNETYSSGYKLFVSSGSSLVFKKSSTVNTVSQSNVAYGFYTARKVFGDFNGDDKTDFFFHNRKEDIKLKDEYISVYHSDGEEFILKRNIDMNLAQSKYFVGDFNGDNRDDVGVVWDVPSGNAPGYTTYLFEDGGLVPMEKVDFPTSGEVYYPGDYDGDGATDLFVTSMRFSDKNWMFFLSKENNTPDEKTVTSSFDLLTKHTSSLGGITKINYRPSSDQDMTDGTMANLHRLPFVLYLVRSVTLDDRVNNTGDDTATFTYSYNDGKYDFPNREFRGFGSITIEKPDGLKTKKYYYQDKEKKGIISKTETDITSENDALAVSQYTWETDPSSDANTFLYLAKEETSIDNKKKYLIYDYDEYGNTISVTTSKDSVGYSGNVSGFTYENADTDKWIWRKTSETVSKKDSGAIGDFEKKTEFDYDNTGNLTLKTSYVNENSYYAIREEYSYNNYGNMTVSNVIDGITNSVEYQYDSSHIYLIKKELPETTQDSGYKIAHTVFYTYNTSFGEIKTEKDENGHETVYTYDPFGRQKTVNYPDGGQIMKIYTDNNEAPFKPSRVKTTVKDSTSDSSWSQEFFDGMGKLVQTLSSHSSANVIIRTEYDGSGRVVKVSGPGTTLSTDLLEDVSLSSPYVETEFDGLSRPTGKTMPHPGDDDKDTVERVFLYNGYTTTIIEPDGGQKKEIKNYLGRIVQIQECKVAGCAGDSDWITTSYKYNTVGDLIKVTSPGDHVNQNIMSMEYDMMGRKTAINDPDTGTTTFGFHDITGKLVNQTDNSGDVTSFTYDELNRITVKANLSTKRWVFYNYDTGKNGKGKLAYMTWHKSGSHNWGQTNYEEYDVMGRAIKVSQINNTLKRTTEYKYDLGG